MDCRASFFHMEDDEFFLGPKCPTSSRSGSPSMSMWFFETRGASAQAAWAYPRGVPEAAYCCVAFSSV